MNNIRNIIPANVKTRLDKMNLLDRFLFNETVEDPEVYNAMVEILLEGHVSMIHWTETEKEVRVSPQLRQIRLDVISADEDGYTEELVNVFLAVIVLSSDTEDGYCRRFLP